MNPLDDKGIREAARWLIEEYGEAAEKIARERLREFIGPGALGQGEATCRRILEAVLAQRLSACPPKREPRKPARF